MPGIPMPDEEQLPPGPRRELTAAVHLLYLAAGKPSLRRISKWIQDQDDLRGTFTHEGVAAVLKGKVVPRWDNLDSLVRVLVDQRRVGQSDLDEVLKQIHALWTNVDNAPAPDSAPALIELPSQVAPQTETQVPPADNTESAASPSSEEDVPAAATLEEIRAEIIAAQHREHEEKLDVYRRILTSRSPREALIDALSQATEEQHISEHGVRVRVWETNLYYRFIARVLPGGRQLSVRLEKADGHVVSDCEWEPAEAAGHFYGRLVAAVRAAGRDLGVGLNDPTESVERLSEMLVEIADFRAQELMGYRYTIWRVIQKEGIEDAAWYFTETALIPAHQPSYEILYTRLDEIDWEQHLRGKGWHGAEEALHLARLVHASLTT